MLRSSAVAQRNALLARRLSAVELLEMHMARIAVLNPMLNAVVLHNFDAAFDAAHKADQALAAGLPPRPLHGIPMTVKESYDVVGYPTTWGMTGYRENRPSLTAPAVERLIEAGANSFAQSGDPPANGSQPEAERKDAAALLDRLWNR